MADEQSSKNFFTTLPGIITAVAALITAVGGFILILNKTGCVGAKSSDTEQIEPRVTKDSNNHTTNTTMLTQKKENDSSANNLVVYAPATVTHATRNLRYKIEDASVERIPDGTSVLNVKLKCTNNSAYEYHFYSSYIGLGIDGDNYGPDPYSPSGNYQSIPEKSFKLLEYNFRVPRGVKNFTLDFYDQDNMVGSSSFTLR